METRLFAAPWRGLGYIGAMLRLHPSKLPHVLLPLLAAIPAISALGSPSSPGTTLAGDTDQDAEFTSLLTGEALAAWKGDPGFWSIEEGRILGESTPENPCKASTYLVLEGTELGDFELRFRYRIQGGNSGLQFRSRLTDSGTIAGYQADIEDGPNWTGCLYEQDGRGVVARRGESVHWSAEGQRSAEAFGDFERMQSIVRKGDWNEYRILAVGTALRLEVNGVRTVDFVDDDGSKRSLAGLLALQLHAGGPMRIEVEDLRWRPLEELPVATELPENLRSVVADPAESEEPEQAQDRPSGAAVPEWIWAAGDAEKHRRVWFQRAFEVPAGVTHATLFGSCDNHMEVRLNGEVVATSSEWTEAVRIDVADVLAEGRNVLSAFGRNDGGPAGLLLELLWEFEGGEVNSVVTDGSWAVTLKDPGSAFESESWVLEGGQAPESLGKLGVGPWGKLAGRGGAAGLDAQERALPAEDLVLPEGFEAELIYSVPRARQGSWVSLTIDDQGRLITSDQYGGLYRTTPAPWGSEERPKVESLDLALGGAQGLLWTERGLYVVVAGGGGASPGLYLARDRDGDDRFEDFEMLRPLSSGGEHGPHAVLESPGGRGLYVIAGNHVPLPDFVTGSRVPRQWGEDQLLPRRPDANGHAAGIQAPGGWIARTDFEGREWELFACGFRNAYDFAFDAHGEMFTFDSDMEWDVGLPWYRPTVVDHVTSGADFGWRHGSGKWPYGYPDMVAPVAEIGLASPTGVAFGNPDSFPGRWGQALYVLDWAYGKVYAVHFDGDGASPTATYELFAAGEPFPVTDVAMAADGSMIITTGGRNAQSGVYRIRWAGEGGLEDTTRATAWGSEAASEARAKRRFFESMHRPDVVVDVDRVLEGLGDADRQIRSAARIALEHQPVERWAQAVLALPTEANAVWGSLEGLLALARSGTAAHRDSVFEALTRVPFAELSTDQRIAALRVQALALIRLGEPTPFARERLVAQIEGQFPSGEAALDRELLQILVRHRVDSAIPRAIELLESDPTSVEAIHIAWVLRYANFGWTPDLRVRQFGWIDNAIATMSGGNSFTGYLQAMRRDSLGSLGPNEALPIEASAPQNEKGKAREADAHWRAWTAQELTPLLGGLEGGRDFESGRDAFSRARCLECHRFAEEGGGTGPDLTGAGARFNPRDLVEAILDPSRTIPDLYLDTEVWLHDGTLVVGRLGAQNDERVVIQPMEPGSEPREIQRDEIEILRPHAHSRMPSGLVDVLTEDEVLDLIAYLRSGGDAENAAFKPR